MNISPIYFTKNISKITKTQTNSINYKNELKKDTISFSGSGNHTASTCELPYAYLSYLPNKQFLSILLDEEQEYKGVTLQRLDDETFCLLMKAAKDKGCLEDIVFQKSNKTSRVNGGRAPSKRDWSDDVYVLLHCLDDKRNRQVFDIADDSLKEKMLQTCEYSSLLEDKYSSFPGISCVTKPKDQYSSSLFLSKPYFSSEILTKKQKKAQETILNSKNPQEVAQA